MAQVTAHEGNKLTLQVTVNLSGSLIKMENNILDGCNEMGSLVNEGWGLIATLNGFCVRIRQIYLEMRHH